MAALGGCAGSFGAEPASGIVVTEVSAAGMPDDWVEVMNVSGDAVDLDDFVIVDKRGKLDRARPLGAVTLSPGERYVRVVSHATVGFRLGRGESVWIYRAADGELIDGIDWPRGASPPGGSFARKADTGAFVTVRTDTRGDANE